MFCHKCGNEIKEDMSFCTACGTVIKSVGESTEEESIKKSSFQENLNKSLEKTEAVKKQLAKSTILQDWLYFLKNGLKEPVTLMKNTSADKYAKSVALFVLLKNLIISILFTGTIADTLKNILGSYSGILRSITHEEVGKAIILSVLLFTIMDFIIISMFFLSGKIFGSAMGFKSFIGAYSTMSTWNLYFILLLFLVSALEFYGLLSFLLLIYSTLFTAIIIKALDACMGIKEDRIIAAVIVGHIFMFIMTIVIFSIFAGMFLANVSNSVINGLTF